MSINFPDSSYVCEDLGRTVVLIDFNQACIMCAGYLPVNFINGYIYKYFFLLQASRFDH